MRPSRTPQDWSPAGKTPGRPLRPRFVDGYLEAALWSSLDPGTGEPLDARFSVEDFSNRAVLEAVRDSDEFVRRKSADLDATLASDESLGHDFWLTRNNHGSGYWDHDYGDAGERLTRAAHAFGESDVYVGDDGMLHLT